MEIPYFPFFDPETKERNDRRVASILDKYSARPKTNGLLVKVITEAFIMGADGSDEAIHDLEDGGLSELLTGLNLDAIDTKPTIAIGDRLFGQMIRNALAYGTIHTAVAALPELDPTQEVATSIL